jgi:hypothetical protein
MGRVSASNSDCYCIFLRAGGWYHLDTYTRRIRTNMHYMSQYLVLRCHVAPFLIFALRLSWQFSFGEHCSTGSGV